MEKIFKILDRISVNVKVSENPYNFELEDLFLMAGRKNPKRAFLFVSKLLGKHIPVNAKRAILTGTVLAFLMKKKLNKNQNNQGQSPDVELIIKAIKEDKYLDQALEYANNNKLTLEKSTLFIGFAETATALGNSMFSQFEGDNISFINTTRDDLMECDSVFNFEEEHSHAISHFCYPLKEDILNKYERIVLVDDEITTGKTALNLIKSINNKYPDKEYVISSILDWRRDEHMEEYKKIEKELGIKIQGLSLLNGQVFCDSSSIKDMFIKYQNHEQYDDEKSGDSSMELEHKYSVLVRDCPYKIDSYKNFTRILSNGDKKEYGYLNSSGRFGILYKEESEIQGFASNVVKNMEPFKNKVLVLGTEEFMYIPMVIASKIPNAKYQSTTRSPIYPSETEGYGIQCASIFKNPFDKDVTNYIYNVKENMYDQVLFITERKIDEESREDLINLFVNLGINEIDFVYFEKANK